MRALPACCLLALVVVAGCTAPVTEGPPATDAVPAADSAPAAGPAPADESTTPSDSDGSANDTRGTGPAGGPPEYGGVAGGEPPDPPTDVLGWEAGVWHNESLAVNQSDGLTDDELDALVARSMARVEVIRGLEFTEAVPVEVVARSTYRNETTWVSSDPSYRAWNDQVWEALFVVDEGTDATAELAALYSSNVLGFYSPSGDRLVVVSDGDGPPTVDNATLVHELMHALQDQHFDLSAPRYGGATQDAELAGNGLTEGEASYVERLYARRCAGEWECVQSSGAGGSSGRVNLGMLMTIFQPYSDGPVYVDHLVERGGWAAVDAAHRDPPESTEQTIHPGREDEPVPVAVEERARNGWSRFEHGVDGADTLGEASIYTMFWYQRSHYRIDVASVGGIFDAEGPLDTYNYSGEPSAGWAGDAVVPYERDGEYGYVWKTAWDSPTDAEEFHRAYLAVLAGHGAERRGAYTWVVPDGGFADAFHVRIDGTTVTVVNAPTVDALDDIRPGIETGPAPTTADGASMDGTTATGSTTDESAMRGSAAQVGRR